MLRIKPDIDLKELEKFGYSKCAEPLLRDYFKFYDNYFIAISERYQDKFFNQPAEINCYKGHITNPLQLFSGFEKAELDEKYIQDLIEAGFIEKL